MKFYTKVDLNQLAFQLMDRKTGLKQQIRIQQKVMNVQSTTILNMYELINELEEKCSKQENTKRT